MKLLTVMPSATPARPATKQAVYLDAADRTTLQTLVSRGQSAARTLTRARILLQADSGRSGPGWTDDQIRDALGVSLSTIVRVRRAWATGGLQAALHRQRPTPARPRKLDGRHEAHLLALACSDPPAGRERWTLQLLADRLVELTDAPAVSYETVRRVLKKTCSSRG